MLASWVMSPHYKEPISPEKLIRFPWEKDETPKQSREEIKQELLEWLNKSTG
jgi:hypothetical protein